MLDQRTSRVQTISALLGDAFGQFSKLLQIEVALAKTEITNEMSRGAVGAGLLGAGVLVLIPAIVMVLLAIAAALTDGAGLSPALANLISAVIGGVVAAILIAIAVAKMRSMQLPPRRTVEQLRKDRQTLSEVAR
jgi:uncharacterized membrane protein YqjE